ncbi:MAG TPA: potassium-transporting ATPase subunit KdpA [Rhodanobacteraceae bacterium]|nr:potassium-transporting ATPase subunit KdpA [Rhodanobacteraceae bacterium]
MNANPWIQLVIYLAVLFALAWPLGRWIESVLEGRIAGRWRWMRAIDGGLLRIAGSDAHEDMPWWRYAIAIVLFNLLGTLVVYALQRLQQWLPFNPAHLGPVSPDSSFDTAVSFATNTNWQGYAGESTMSHFTQMAALAVQNFFSAATGIVVAIALIRGLARGSAKGLGNAWQDLVRTVLWILLPLSFVLALFLVSQGVPQDFSAPATVQTLQATHYQMPATDAAGNVLKDAKGQPLTKDVVASTQTIALGPVASQESIKELGTNGGGFFNANSAHPFENPTPLTNFLEMLAILLIPAALVFAFGRMVGDKRQGIAVLAAMTILFVGMYAVGVTTQAVPNPLITHLGVSGPGMEGIETRFGTVASMLFAAITTAASCGAVNAMHDSLMPLAGGVPMFLIQLGEVVFGGVGSGLYGMLIFAVLAVFIAGLMIGRTPEYLGKKIGMFEMKMVAIAVLVVPLLALLGTAIAVMAQAGRAGMSNPGAHGFSEVLYAFSSAANNNGSAFAGLSANTPFYNVLLAIAMWFGRFLIIVPVLALAGALAKKPRLTVSAGTMPTHGPLFVILLIGAVLLVGALNYVPALALGPVIEHLALFRAH